MILRLPQVILDVGVEVNGFGPAVAEDGLTDVLFVVVAIHGACDTKKSFHINFLINYSFIHISR